MIAGSFEAFVHLSPANVLLPWPSKNTGSSNGLCRKMNILDGFSAMPFSHAELSSHINETTEHKGKDMQR